MAQDRKHLEALLNFIEKLGKEPGNKWFIEQLQKKYGRVPEIPVISSGPKIDEIYEYCIEKVIQAQADDFYKDFPIQSIISDLKQDYRRMEGFHRRDNFGDFCLSIYQQIENICNYFCQSELEKICKGMWDEPSYVKSYDENSQKTIELSFENRDSKCKQNIANFLFFNTYAEDIEKTIKEKTEKPINLLSARDKIKVVVYFVGYKTIMTNPINKNTYRPFCQLLFDIYSCRNISGAHRGKSLEKYEEEKISAILQLKSLYYFKFFGALAQFVEFIREGYSFLDKLRQRFCTWETAIVTKIMPSAVVVKINSTDRTQLLPDKLLSTFRELNKQEGEFVNVKIGDADKIVKIK